MALQPFGQDEQPVRPRSRFVRPQGQVRRQAHDAGAMALSQRHRCGTDAQCPAQALIDGDGALTAEARGIVEATDPGACIDTRRRQEFHKPSDKPGLLIRKLRMARPSAQAADRQRPRGLATRRGRCGAVQNGRPTGPAAAPCQRQDRACSRSFQAPRPAAGDGLTAGSRLSQTRRRCPSGRSGSCGHAGESPGSRRTGVRCRA